MVDEERAEKANIFLSFVRAESSVGIGPVSNEWIVMQTPAKKRALSLGKGMV